MCALTALCEKEYNVFQEAALEKSHTKPMGASYQPEQFRLPEAGTLLGMPPVPGEPRRAWVTRDAGRRAAAPVSGVFSVYAPDFFLDTPDPWLVPEGPADLEWVHALTAAAVPVADTPPPPLLWRQPSHPAFDRVFDDLQDRFQSGQLAKVVPVFFEQADYPQTNLPLAQWVSKLLHVPGTLTPYGRWTASEGVLGASPETLFSIQSGILRTMALAGTLAAPPAVEAAAAEARFLADPKERREHALVIEGMAETLAPFGTVQVGETAVVKLPTLWHLQTPLEVSLSGTPSFEAVARALHPTPALGGLPRAASTDWLRRLDTQAGQQRGTFGAPFGAQLADGSAFCLIGVRSLQWAGQTLRIGAGCGIIRESVAEREWAEYQRKRDSVKRLLGL